MDLQEAVKRCDSERYNYPDVFADDCGLDIKIPEKKLHAVKSWKNKRSVTLVISTWVGISFGAIHYYGKLEIDGVHMEYDDKPNHSTSVDEEVYPLAEYKYELKIRRELTQKEIEDDPDRWEWYHEGSMTNCYETIEALIADAKEIIKLRFRGQWAYKIEYPWGRKESLIIE